MLKFKIPVTLLLSAAVLSFASCAKDVKNQPDPTPGPEPEQSVFDFSTKASYTLNVKYNVPDGYKVYFEVYAENPYVIENEQMVKKQGLAILDNGYTDGSGSYSKKITVPSYIKEMYIYSPNAGVEQVLVTKVSGNSLTTPEPLRNERNASQSMATKAPSERNTFMFTGYFKDKTKLLGSWVHSTTDENIPNVGYTRISGRPMYMRYVDKRSFNDGQEDAKVISSDIFKAINTVLPGEGKGEVKSEFLQSGDIHITKDAEIDMIFIDQQCLYRNTLAYYIYETANPPQSVNDIKFQTIIFPNARKAKAYDYGEGSTNFGCALLPGEGVRLKYYDKDGNASETFPAGTSIGWILHPESYRIDIIQMKEPIYSSPTLMNNIPHVAVFRSGDFVVTSFEDSKRSSVNQVSDFKDLIFHVASTPADAITPGVPPTEPEEPANITNTYRGILSFEDIWPYRGDFDMNDVVVQYVANVTSNSNNQVIESSTDYTILWSGAELNNSFAYQDPNIAIGNPTFTFTGGVGTPTVDSRDNIIRLAAGVKDYANKEPKQVFNVKCVYGSPIAKDSYVKPPYNPFITVNGVETHEVHLTNMTPTAIANKALFGTGHDKSKPEKGIYYVTYDDNGVQLPFAIDVTFANDTDMKNYVIPKERERIDQYYPTFIKWVQSGGKESADWYLNPKK